MNYGTEYWFLTESDYADLVNACQAAGATYALTAFGTAHHVSEGDYKGYYFDMDEIDTEEMEWLGETFMSFDLRVVNLSVQAGWSPVVP